MVLGTSHGQDKPPLSDLEPPRVGAVSPHFVLSLWVHSVTWTALFMPQDLNPGASILETQQWLHRHRFSSYCQLLANFTGKAGVW